MTVIEIIITFVSGFVGGMLGGGLVWWVMGRRLISEIKSQLMIGGQHGR